MTFKVLAIIMATSFSGGPCANAQTSQQWRDSLSVLNKQISQEPYSSDLYLRKAAVNIELQQWDYDLASADYETFLIFAPTNIEARLGLAYTLVKRGKSLEALDQYNIIVEQHPDSAVAYASRACLEEDMKQYDTALFDWGKAVSLSPSNNDYLLSIANLFVKMKRRSDALKCLNELLQRGIARADIEELLKLCK